MHHLYMISKTLFVSQRSHITDISVDASSSYDFEKTLFVSQQSHITDISVNASSLYDSEKKSFCLTTKSHLVQWICLSKTDNSLEGERNKLYWHAWINKVILRPCCYHLLALVCILRSLFLHRLLIIQLRKWYNTKLPREVPRIYTKYQRNIQIVNNLPWCLTVID